MLNGTQTWSRTGAIVLIVFACMISAKIMITKVDYVSNADYLTMKVQVHNETEGSTVDVDGNLYMDVSQGVFVNIDLDSKMDGQYMTMIGTSKELCSTDDVGMDPVVPLLNEELEKFGNLTFNCPFQKGYYRIRRFRMSDDHMLVKMVPPGQYIVKMDLQHQQPNATDKNPVFKLSFYFEIS
uniref:MD-2-related lipid-recognition domain-containing protein n=1 Tax=Anopheles epiroticus TaxID=199890 RepID=A0A182PEJ5_9DIPT